ncbi:MAG: ATP synthase F1 subunit gamma [Gaiellaceae bacterium]|jgi:F-type H+-transporting ATPase subunit gamma
MATVQELRRRVRAVTNTRKLTKAMELVASARLRRAQERIEAMRPYADRMLELMAGTARASASVRGLPLLQRRDVHTVAIVPVTGDRGLAGAFNAQILRRAMSVSRELEAQNVQVRWLPVGRKGTASLRFRRLELQGQWGGFSDNPSYGDAQAVAHRLAELYVNEEVDRVVLVYNAFVSALVQRVTVSDVLPISEDVLETSDDERERDRLAGDFIFEPEPDQILERLLPVYLETEIYRALLESAASEQGARMTAMRNASKSAGELIDSITLAMNRARQAEITQEILEVVAGADALTG